MARWESAHVSSRVMMCVNAKFEISKSKALSLVPFLAFFVSHAHRNCCGQLDHFFLDETRVVPP